MKKVFILNPRAGTGSKVKLRQLIESYCSDPANQATLLFTQYAGHAGILAAEAAHQEISIIVAVGGDGTVNEVAGSLVHRPCILGIIPAGSGNGLARHLGIPMDAGKALSLLDSGQTIKMDTMLVNGRLSVNISGTGFDAYVAGLFANAGRRGFVTYARLSVSGLRQYRPADMTLSFEGKTISCRPFLLVFANGSQWGNHAWIAPGAVTDDGLITVGIMERPPWYALPAFVGRLFGKGLSGSSYLTYFQAREIRLNSSRPVALHIDGEAAGETTHLTVRIQPASLNILVR